MLSASFQGKKKIAESGGESGRIFLISDGQRPTNHQLELFFGQAFLSGGKFLGGFSRAKGRPLFSQGSHHLGFSSGAVLEKKPGKRRAPGFDGKKLCNGGPKDSLKARVTGLDLARRNRGARRGRWRHELRKDIRRKSLRWMAYEENLQMAGIMRGLALRPEPRGAIFRTLAVWLISVHWWPIWIPDTDSSPDFGQAPKQNVSGGLSARPHLVRITGSRVCLVFKAAR